jgi:hypothetical protein
MRRLDELLTHATTRGERMGPERLIERLERRLQGESEVVVAAPRRGLTMLDTKERPFPAEIPSNGRTRWAFALAGFAVAVAAVVAAVILIGGTSSDSAEGPQTPLEVLAVLEEAVRAVDPVQYADLTLITPTGTDEGFMEWNIALGLDPVLSDCSKNANSVDGNPVTCTVTMGEDYFFSTVLGENASSWVDIRVDNDGTFNLQSWPPPLGLTTIEAEMRLWIKETHPEVEDRMFGSDYADIRFSREAGELHMEYLDEYLAYRKTNS